MEDELNNINTFFNQKNGYINNKYKYWYISLMTKSLARCTPFNSSEHEKHHIIPRSLGGIDINSNLAILTFREHYIAHLLLTRFTLGKNKHKMCFALHTFFHLFASKSRNQFYPERLKYLTRGRNYSNHKKMFIEACKHRAQSVGALDLTVFVFKNQKTTDEFIGTRYDFKQYSGLSHQEIYTLINYKYRMRHIKQWGVYRPELKDFSFNEHRPSTTAFITSKTCPHCGRTVDNRNYSRWHGENCKQLLATVCSL